MRSSAWCSTGFRENAERKDEGGVGWWPGGSGAEAVNGGEEGRGGFGCLLLAV